MKIMKISSACNSYDLLKIVYFKTIVINFEQEGLGQNVTKYVPVNCPAAPTSYHTIGGSQNPKLQMFEILKAMKLYGV